MPKKLFVKGNTEASKKKGKKHKLTIVKETLGTKNIEDLKDDCLTVFKDMLDNNDETKKFLAAKEISKYIFPQKREHSGELNQNITVNFKY